MMNTCAAEADVIFAMHNVAAAIEGRSILVDVDLELRRGEHLGIVGANGAGKSTLLRLISGSLWPTPGRGTRTYYFDGHAHRDAVAARARITLLGPEHQDAYVRLGWNFSALAVVVTGLHKTEIPRRTASAADLERAAALLGRLSAGDLAERPFLELSRGEQRRVLLARALAFGAEVLLLDEPGSGLDAAARRELDAAIAAAAREATIVATAHIPSMLPDVVAGILEVRGHTVRPLGTQDHGAATLSVAGSVDRPDGTEHDREPEAPQSAAPALIELRNADVWVGERRVLCNIDWTLRRGENWLVTGDNGAGKSTFLRLLHGQLRPARGGTIDWPAFGSPRNVWALRRRIGWVSPELQANYRYPSTVSQCVASGFRSSIGLLGTLSDRQRARRDELLAAFELEALAQRRLSKLSYGQARRALLARTLASEPELLLLDEPWEGLDPDTVALVLRQLRLAMQHGMQIVCASHVGDAGLGLDHVLEIRDGAIRSGVAA